MEDLMATFADAQEVKQNIEKAKTGLQAAQANGLEALEKVITEISETGRSVFILNKKNPDGSTRYDIRQARQSRYWVLSDAEFYKFIRFNMKEENGNTRTTRAVANYDWVVLLKEKEPSTTTVYERLHQNSVREIHGGGQRLVDQKRAEAGPQPSIDTMVEIAELERMLTEEKIGMGKIRPPGAILLKEWSHARNTNNTDNNTDGYLFTIFQADAGQADDPRFAPQAAEIGDLRPGAEGAAKARGAEGEG
eukprot:tig00000292_g23866.t1